MTNTLNTPIESVELHYPLRVVRYEQRRGSGGDGRERGGDGIVRKIEFLRRLKVSMLSERRGPDAPFGLNGAEPGRLGRNCLQRGNEIRDLGGKFAMDISPGDMLVIETPGGGGVGAEV